MYYHTLKRKVLIKINTASLIGVFSRCFAYIKYKFFLREKKKLMSVFKGFDELRICLFDQVIAIFFADTITGKTSSTI